MSGPSSAHSFRFLDPAKAEVIEAARNLRTVDPDVVAAFEADLAHALERLMQFPEIGVVVRKRGELRYRKWALRKFRFNLIYLLAGDEIVIYAVAHQSRRPGYWARRLKPVPPA